MPKSPKHSKKVPGEEYFLSFAGCGFLGLYHTGVCACIQTYAPQLYRNKKIGGASAGALAAAVLACELDLNACVEYMLRVVSKAQIYYLGPFDPRFKITEQLREGLEMILPKNAHEICSGRLHISMTSTNRQQNVIINYFRTKEELVRALLCSAYIPLFSGYIPLTYYGEWMVDGAMTNNVPSFGDKTIIVSPFSGEADICPKDDWAYGQVHLANTSILVNFNNLCRMLNIVWPKSLSELQKLTENGYNDALKYLARKGFIHCNGHSALSSGQVIFLTVSICSHHGLVEHCPECKKRLREALNSSLPESVTSMFTNVAKKRTVTGRHWVHSMRLFRIVRLLASPTQLTMAILYSIILCLMKLLSSIPAPLRALLEPLHKVVHRLHNIIHSSLKKTTDRHRQAAILCEALQREYTVPQLLPSRLSRRPSIAAASQELPTCVMKEKKEPDMESLSTFQSMDRISSLLPEDEMQSIRDEATQFSDDDETLTENSEANLGTDEDETTFDEEDVSSASEANASSQHWHELKELLQQHEVVEQLRELERTSGGDNVVTVESIRPLDVSAYSDYAHDSQVEDVSATGEEVVGNDVDDGIESGAASDRESAVDTDEQPPSSNFVASSWSYQEYEGSNITKVFMVLPVSSSSTLPTTSTRYP